MLTQLTFGSKFIQLVLLYLLLEKTFFVEMTHQLEVALLVTFIL